MSRSIVSKDGQLNPWPEQSSEGERLRDRPSDAETEFETLLRTYQTPLLRYTHRLVRNRELAQDIVQEAFLRYLKKPPRFGDSNQRASWLFRVAHNLGIDVLKRETRRGDIHEGAERPRSVPSPLAELSSQERWARLNEHLDRLADNQRTAIVLFFQEEKSYKEIAKITGFSMSNVGMLLHRGLKRLRATIDLKEID